MKSVLVICFLMLSMQSVLAHQLIPLRTLISLPSLSNVLINPSGQILLMSGYEKGDLNIRAVHLKTEQSDLIFQAKHKEGYRLRGMYWLDNQRAVFELFRPSDKNMRVRWLVNFTQSEQGLGHKVSRMNATGYIIDPLVNHDDEVIFAHLRMENFKQKLRLYRASSRHLIRDNFQDALEFDNLISDAFYYRTDPNHRIRFTQTYDKDEIELTQWLLDEQNEWQELFRYDPTEYTFEPIGFLQNGQLAVITNIESDRKSLYEFDVKTQRLGKLIYQNERYDLSNAAFDQQGQTLLSVNYYDGGELQTEYFDQNKQKLNRMAENTFKGQQYHIVSQNKAENKFILRVFSSENSGEFYLWQTDNNTASLLGPQFNKHQNFTFMPTETLDVKGEDGHRIEAFLTSPPADVNNNVLLVMPHGGPVGVRDLSRFSTQLQYFVSRGYTVLQVNYRGSEGYGKKYLDEGRGQFGQNIEKDITTVVNFVSAKQTYNKTCSIGASYGGYSSVMLAVLNPDFYDCVIARFGVFDLPLIFNDRNVKIDEHLIKRWERVVGKNDSNLLRYSPVYFADKVKVPVLITAGQLDTRASFEHSNRLKYSLSQYVQTVEHLYYRRSAHGHTDKKSARHELAYIDDFIRRTLQLPQPKGENSEMIKQNEMNIIAHGFANPDIVGVDNEKVKFYRARAE